MCANHLKFAIAAQRVEIEAMEKNRDEKGLRRLLDPVFLGALALLLLNDHLLKAAYHNFWTGKVSDFAGLYAFAWLGMRLLPGRAAGVAWFLAIAFAFWKSPWVMPLLDAWNAAGILPLHRVLDYGDWAALLVLPMAYRRSSMVKAQLSMARRDHKLAEGLVLCLSIFAFCATSYTNDFDFDAKYDLQIPPSEVVSRLNMISAEDKRDNAPLSLTHQNANEFRQEGDHRIYLHHNTDTQTYCDTIYAQIDDSIFIDEIREYQIPNIDSMYVNPDGIFKYDFSLRSELDTSKTTLQCIVVPAILKLEAHGRGSRLHLLHVETHNCEALPTGETKEKPEDYLRKRFEAVVVARLKQR
jgi:hypothetical protein